MEHGAQTSRQRTIHTLKTAMLFLLVALICAGAFGAAYIFGIDISSRLDPQKIYGADQSTLVYDRNGVEIAVVHGLENRIWVSIDDIPKHVRDAFIAVEDVRFYTHSGVDVKRIFGALINDIKAGQFVEGASTITQQLIKNSLLHSKKQLSRKIEEALLALELERRYEKNDILEMYLNYVYFGANAYGIEAAAKTYFDKSVSALSVDEGALLAGILKSTSRFAPHTNPESSVERRNTVLSLMAQYGFISSEQADAAKSTALDLHYTPPTSAYGFYLDAALASAADILGLTYEEIVTGGYRVYTGMDASLQAIVEDVFTDDSLFPPDANDGTKVQASFVCVDAKTAQVLAIMGGRSYEVQRGLNRAIQSRRQPGSAIKPILVYAPALQSRAYHPAAVIVDEPKSFGPYIPKNFGDQYMGKVTLRQALMHSLNIPAVEVLEHTGLAAAKAFAESVGIPFHPNDNGLSLALGGFETGVTSLELCTAYGALANLGLYQPSHFVTSIEDSAGNVVYSAPDAPVRVLGEDTAFILSDMLRDVVEGGTAKKLLIKDVPLSAKTGTTGFSQNANRDIWVAAYNPDIAAVAWMGFDRTDSEHCLDAAATGGAHTSILMREVLSRYYNERKAPAFMPGEGVSRVRLDKAALQRGELKLAAPYLLDKDVVTEYLYRDQAAALEGEQNHGQCLIFNFGIELDPMGAPVISFSSSSTIASYLVYRVSEGEGEKIVATLDGEDQMMFADESAAANTGYTYSIQPVDENQTPLGVRSERVYVYVGAR